MSKLCCLTALLGVLLANPTWGQGSEPFGTGDDPFASETLDTPSKPTPEETEAYSPGYQAVPDAKALIYRNAAFRAQQRRQRITSLKWYGYSNSRPIASGIPQLNTYSPMWVGNSWNSYHWLGAYVALR